MGKKGFNLKKKKDTGKRVKKKGRKKVLKDEEGRAVRKGIRINP